MFPEVFQPETPEFSNFVGTATTDNATVGRLKAYAKMAKEGKNVGKIVPLSVTIAVQNTDTANALQFYVNPSLLAGAGDDGVPKSGSTFKAIDGTDKLKLISFSGNLPTFLRWLQHKLAVANEIKIAANKEIGISAGNITQWAVSPNLAAGYNQSEPVPFSSYNGSDAFSDKKVEIKDKIFFLDNENATVVTIPAETTLTITINMFAYNSVEYALYYRTMIGQ